MRLAVGIEDGDDLIEDLEQALAAARADASAAGPRADLTAAI